MKPLAWLLLGCLIGVLAGRLWPSVTTNRAQEPISSGTPLIAAPAPSEDRSPVETERIQTPPVRLTSPNDQEWKASLEEIHRKLDLLEQRLASLDRNPVRPAAEAPSESGELRTLVMNVLDERRAIEREREKVLDAKAQEEMRAERSFQIRAEATHIAEEVGLLPADRDRLADILVEFEESQWELQRNFDPTSTDPVAWQTQFDAIRQAFLDRLSSEFSPEQAERLREIWF